MGHTFTLPHPVWTKLVHLPKPFLGWMTGPLATSAIGARLGRLGRAPLWYTQCLIGLLALHTSVLDGCKMDVSICEYNSIVLAHTSPLPTHTPSGAPVSCSSDKTGSAACPSSPMRMRCFGRRASGGDLTTTLRLGGATARRAVLSLSPVLSAAERFLPRCCRAGTGSTSGGAGALPLLMRPERRRPKEEDSVVHSQCIYMISNIYTTYHLRYPPQTCP